MSTFADLGVAVEIVSALAERGVERPFAIQALTISDALAGRDVCGKAKTGSGKTLAFGIPLLQRAERAAPCRPTGLCLVPTRELALQVSNELAPLADAIGKRVAAIFGGEPIDRQIKELEAGVEVLVCTPGRMIDLIEREAVSLESVTNVVVDEADRMADMGFLPQVEWILRTIGQDHQTLLFSATLDGAVEALVRRYQHDPVRHEVESPTATVDEMQHLFFAVHDMDRVRVVKSIVAGSQRTIIFCGTKHQTDRLASALRSEGVHAEAIHGDLPQRTRQKALRGFTIGEIPVLIATDVAARGIHVDDVGTVIHFDPPPDHKTYLHRSGRTARAGTSGVVVTLVLWNQELEVRRLQRRCGLDLPIEEVFSNNPALADLSQWRAASVSTNSNR